MRLIKFDTLYPVEYINARIKSEESEIKEMNFKEFHHWLINLRMNYSDFYTYNLNFHGWEAEEFFLNNDIYLKKCGQHYWGWTYKLRRIFHRFRNMLSQVSVPFAEKIIEKHIISSKADVIYIREQVFIRSKFWERFRNTMLVVSRMDCGIPPDWSPLSFDIIYSNIPAFINFFKANNVPVLNNNNGFDERILQQLEKGKKKYDVSFVGGLGSYYGFVEKSKTFENILLKYGDNIDFYWWGYKTGDFDNQFPVLAKHYMGHIAGIDMFNIYAQSKIVLNDYGAGVGGVGVNQRIYEVLGTGSLLITRESKSLENWENYLVTYNDVDDCAGKIQHYLNHEKEREKIAGNGQEFVLKNFNYKKLMAKLSDELNETYHNKFRK